ncbi:MAG: flagellar basal body-associated FliL family protein [SAR324 cluster bacterium]|nr:flagellar basal body-associated FliL family protein [SAR324 cluster bacterium]
MTEVNELSFSRGGGMAEGEGGGGLGRIIKIAVIALVLLLLIGGGGYAAFVFLTSGGDEEGKVAQSGATIRQGPAPLENPVFFQAGTFIVNLADGRRYLKTNVELMLNEELAKVYLEGRLSEVKDLIIAELQTLSTEQLRDPKERVLLKERLKGRIETLFPLPRDLKWDDPKPIKKVLFTEFYLQ